jgi:hypothetical protein
LTVASLLSHTALGQDSPGRAPGTAPGCCARGGLVADVELTFLQYRQERGVVTPPRTDFGLDLAPRFELGYMAGSDVGIRSRYWFYDVALTSTDGPRLAVDAYTIDWELFHERCIGCGTQLEFSCGLRYLDFKQVAENPGFMDPKIRDFRGWGGIFGIEARHPLWIGSAYARGRWGVLLGDADTGVIGGRYRNPRGEVLQTATLSGTTSTVTELGFGYEMTRDLGCWGTCSVRFGGEWQTWSDMVVGSRYVALEGVPFYEQEILEADDAAFAGLVLGMEWRR